MNYSTSFGLLVAAACFTLILLSSCLTSQPLPDFELNPDQSLLGTAAVTGVVHSDEGPVTNAIVRVQATENKVITGNDGVFKLTGLRPQETVTITASAPGHYIGWTAVQPDATETVSVTVELYEHFITDNFEYDWFEENGLEGSEACGACHPSYAEWLADGHSQSAVNPRFLTMYAGTDVHGNKSPPYEKSNLGVPLPPDLTKPYYGPGFKLDFPTISGSCATCHTPTAAKQSNKQNCGWSGCHQDSTSDFAGQTLDRGVSPLDLKSDAAEGISCEFCHKIGHVSLDRKTGLPYPDLPGILSLRLYRPDAGHDLLFGPLDDIARTDIPASRDVYLPLQEESRFCAGCHYGILGGVVVGNMQVKGGVLVYSSFSEWLDSPYSDEQSGQTCQDCHMPSGDANYIAYPERGGVFRDPSQVHNHRMLSEELLHNALTLSADATMADGKVQVAVNVTNNKTGHHVPTDSPLRHVMLVVTAQDDAAQPLPLLDGSLLPEWTGNYSGQPGRAYAKILQDEWTGESPTGAIWRPVQIKEDTRIAAMSSDISHYEFDSLDTATVTVTVRLIYRKAFQQLAQWKGWNDPDIVMEETTLQLKVR